LPGDKNLLQGHFEIRQTQTRSQSRLVRKIGQLASLNLVDPESLVPLVGLAFDECYSFIASLVTSPQ
jgi:hypothetical protein